MTLGELKDAIKKAERDLKLKGVNEYDIDNAVIRGRNFDDGYAELDLYFEATTAKDEMEKLNSFNWWYTDYEESGYRKETIDERVNSSPCSILFYHSNDD